jgi:hypothetical protein
MERAHKGHDRRESGLTPMTRLAPLPCLTCAYQRHQHRGDEGTRTLNPRRAKRDPPYRPLPTSTVPRVFAQFSCYLVRLAVNECQRFRSLSAPSALLGVTASLL